MKRYLIIILPLLFLNWTGLNAQDDSGKSKLDEYFHQLEKNNKAMCGVVIAKDGKVEYENYIGFSSVKDTIRNGSVTKFRIGSITKMFTATIIFQLIEEGRVTQETKLSEFYPQIPNSKDISIADLLSHRSGIHSFTSEEEYLQYMTSKKTKDEMLKMISGYKPDFKPGEKNAYSNSNYVLLGYIIEKVTNTTYRQELNTRISSRINLANTFYGKKIDTEKNEAASYKFQEGKWQLQPETDLSIPHGAGAIVSTPNELAAFITALFNHKLLSENSLKQMAKINDGFGKGLIRFPFGNKFAYGHDGGIDGFVSNLAYFPDEKIAIAVIANGVDYNFNNILIGILSIYFNIPFEIPDFTVKAIQLDKEVLKKYAGEFSSKALPLIITLKVESGELFAQASGQSAFPLTPFSQTEFRFEQAGIVVEFTKDDKGKIQYNSFILNQAGKKYPYEKQ